jgi:hypothetical protein
VHPSIAPLHAEGLLQGVLQAGAAVGVAVGLGGSTIIIGGSTVSGTLLKSKVAVVEVKASA